MGVKDEEIEYTNLAEFLATAGPEVTKDQLNTYVSFNGVSVEITELGDGGSTPYMADDVQIEESDKEIITPNKEYLAAEAEIWKEGRENELDTEEEFDEAAEKSAFMTYYEEPEYEISVKLADLEETDYVVLGSPDSGWRLYNSLTGKMATDTWAAKPDELLAEAVSALRRDGVIPPNDDGGKPHYPDNKLTGGTNYREFLLQLPPRTSEKKMAQLRDELDMYRSHLASRQKMGGAALAPVWVDELKQNITALEEDIGI